MSELDFINEWDEHQMVANRPTVRLKIVDKFLLWRKFRREYVKNHSARLKEALEITGEFPSRNGESLE